MHRSTKPRIQLAAIVLFVTAARTYAYAPGHLFLHTNQEDFVSHSNQESAWQQVLSEPQPMRNYFSNPPTDPFTADRRDLLSDPWSHGNSPRITTLPAGLIPAPGVVVLLGLAGLLGVPTRRRRRIETDRPAG
jgi:hypothetical protein